MKPNLSRMIVWLGLCGTVTLTVGERATAAATPTDGRWRYVYSCERATGIYADKCAAGDRDEFMIWLGSSGDHLCGYFAITAQLGNHADEGDLSVQKDMGRSVVSFDIWGSTGEATVRVNKGQLFWDVIKRISGTSFSVPDHLILTRDPGKPAWSCKN